MQNVRLYFDIGTPHNHTHVFGKGILLTPKLKSLDKASGSVGGTVITASIAGVGIQTLGIQLKTLAGDEICQEVKVISYGKV